MLTGTINKIIDKNSVQVNQNWPIREDILKGYIFKVNAPAMRSRVVSFDIQSGVLKLEDALFNADLMKGQLFSLAGGEEAPILAARCATSTPLERTLPLINMRLGTTRGTNALLEHQGAKTALLITKGFKDLLKIGTQQRPDLFALAIEKPKQLPELVLEVNERIDSKGQVLHSLNNKDADKIIEVLTKQQIESIAVSFMNSYKNPIHEHEIAKKLTLAGFRFVSTSTRLFPAIKYLPRTETAVVNAYLSPIMELYLDNIQRALGENGNLKIMGSAGFLANPSHFEAKDSLLSGPAGGIVGAAQVAKQAGIDKCLTLDMGGTSTDVARYDGNFDYVYEIQIGAAHLFAQSMAIETVAAGGGSICSYNDVKLEVGPGSAGAYPGPTCYGNDGPLAVTDLNLLTGRIVPSHFGIPVIIEAAQKAFNTLASRISDSNSNQDHDELLLGYLQIANQKMADAVRKISVSKGFDPSEYTLLGFGGAAGQHLCDIAELLHVKQILVPRFGSLLSAEGISHALLEQSASQQILQPLSNRNELRNAIESLTNQVFNKLRDDGIANPQLKAVQVFMRLKGQDTTIAISYSHMDQLQSAFKQEYMNLYGHWVERPIEVESVKVMASEPAPETRITPEQGIKHIPTATSTHRVLFNEGWQDTPLFEWDKLSSGAVLKVPALLTNQFTTILITTGWQLTVHDQYVLIDQTVQEKIQQKGAQSSSKQAINIELFTNRFRAVADQMGVLLQRTALSVNIKERADFSCALLDKTGYLVVNAPHIPVHLGSLGICVRSVLQSLSLEQGDVVITNHPGYGGSHLPDVTLVAPVFYADQLIGYVANRAHHAEIGGKSPGSMPADAKNLLEEGVVIKPRYLVKQNEPLWPEIEEILNSGPYPSRAVAENLADLQASLASIKAGQNELIKLCEQYTFDHVSEYMHLLKDLASDKIISKLNSFDKACFEAEEQLDDGSPIHVSITIGEYIDIDFTGTGDVHPGNLNATEAIVNGAVIYVLRLLSESEIPLHEGMMNKVRLTIPNGMLNPDFPDDPKRCPAVVGGNTEISQRLVDTLLKAFGVAACGQGTMNNFLFGNDEFGYYETIGGGAGAVKDFKGADAVHQHMTNTQITDPEILEYRYPVQLQEFSIRPNSGGTGQWSGGNGIIRKFKFMAPMTATILSQHRKIQPYGLQGGLPGQKGQQQLLLSDGKKTILQGIETFTVNIGDEVTIETPGGGGYGKPD